MNPARGTKLRLRGEDLHFAVITAVMDGGCSVLLWPCATTSIWTWAELERRAEVLSDSDSALPSEDHWAAVEIIGRLFAQAEAGGGALHIPQSMAADIVRRAKRAMRVADAQYLAPAVSLLCTCPAEGMRLALDDADELAEAVGVALRLAPSVEPRPAKADAPRCGMNRRIE